MTTFAITLASRQTPASRFSHWEIPDSELIDRVSKALPDAKQGYREGVLEVAVDPEGFFSPVVELREGDVLVGAYESRRPGEEPRKSIRRRAEIQGKSAAVAVDVILYRHDVLGDDASSDADWEIISVNARVTMEPEPIHPDTLIANHFELDGGTPTNMVAIEFITALRRSVLYWKNRTLTEARV
jgi:hypothetical protein